MELHELKRLLDELRRLPSENEWVEFKVNNYESQSIGEYISALSNSACLHRKEFGCLVFGIEDETHTVKGTTFKPKETKVGNEELENWLAHNLNPRIDFKIFEFDYEGKNIVIFRIDPASSVPVRFKGVGYIQVGSYKKKLAEHAEKERKIWSITSNTDWSAQICEDATIEDLEPNAIKKARLEYKNKNPGKATEVDEWDDITFLNKAKVIIQGKITRTAIILLGKEESEHFISPSAAKMSWILKDENNNVLDYEHFGPPFVLNTELVLNKIRNLKYRYLPDNTLFPIEITKYEPYVIREALHNCIAHQDYELQGRINVVEKPDELIFTNMGSFIPGSVEAVIEQNAPQEYYRNKFLAEAMVNLNMIDTIGSGIKKMFTLQSKRYFPMPDYDLSEPERLKVKIIGKIIDENYTRILINKIDLDLKTIIALDKVQKKERLDREELKKLKAQNLVEGRYPNLFVAAKIAAATGDKSKYMLQRGLDEKFYKDMILESIKKFSSMSRSDIDGFLMKKLPDTLDEKQKRNKIKNLLYVMSKKEKSIKNEGPKKKPKWILT